MKLSISFSVKLCLLLCVWLFMTVESAPRAKRDTLVNQVLQPTPEEAPVSPAKEDQEMNADGVETQEGQSADIGLGQVPKRLKRKVIDAKILLGDTENLKSQMISRNKRNSGALISKIRTKREVPSGYYNYETGPMSDEEDDSNSEIPESDKQAIQNFSDKELLQLLYLLGKLQESEENFETEPLVDYDRDYDIPAVNIYDGDYTDPTSDYEFVPIDVDYADDDSSGLPVDQPMSVPYVVRVDDTDYDNFSPVEQETIEESPDRQAEAEWMIRSLAQEALREADDQEEQEEALGNSILASDPAGWQKRSEPVYEVVEVPDYDGESDGTLTNGYGMEDYPEEDISPPVQELEGFLVIPLDEGLPSEVDSDELSSRDPKEADFQELKERIALLAEELNDRQDMGLLR